MKGFRVFKGNVGDTVCRVQGLGCRVSGLRFKSKLLKGGNVGDYGGGYSEFGLYLMTGSALRVWGIRVWSSGWDVRFSRRVACRMYRDIPGCLLVFEMYADFSGRLGFRV